MREWEHIAAAFPGSRVVSARPLTGGVSAQTTALEIEQRNGEREKVVVRGYSVAAIAQNPQLATHEFHLLRFLQSRGLPVPAPRYADPAGAFIVIAYIEGSPEFEPANGVEFAQQFAGQLAAIHTIGADAPALAFLPSQNAILTETLANPPAVFDDSLSEGRIRASLNTVGTTPYPNAPVLLHGDYWQGNVLWDNGRIAAVIDWEDAALGDPLADVANSRLELCWLAGREVMEAFMQQYRATAEINFNALPYWDLAAALRPAHKLSTWGLDEESERSMRATHREFVESALAALNHR